MEALKRVDQVFECALDFVRVRILPWLLHLKIGKFGGKVGACTVLLFFPCFIRPTDLTEESDIRLPFRRFGIAYALAPASLYALANVEMFKHFSHDEMPLPPANSPIAELIFFLGIGKIMSMIAFVFFISLTYLFGLSGWIWNQIVCRILGSNLTRLDRVSLAYFLLKSCASMAIFSLFTWIIAVIATMDQKTRNVVVVIAHRISDFLSIYDRQFVFFFLVLSFSAIGLASSKLCWMNGRAAMREIYVTDATSEQVTEMKVLVAVTLFALMAFLPRLTGVRH